MILFEGEDRDLQDELIPQEGRSESRVITTCLSKKSLTT